MSARASPPPPEPVVRTMLPPGWDARLRDFSIDRRARIFRAQLGLPTDRPIVMTGHQPVVWHAGILAKYLAADAIAQHFNGVQAHLLIDHGDEDPFSIRVPALDDRGIPIDSTIELATGRREGQPVRSRPGATIDPAPDPPFALPSVGAGVKRIGEAFETHAGAPSAAWQAALALEDLIENLARPGTVLMATQLADTGLYRSLVERMLSDPGGMARSYNDAAASIPEAGIKPLAISGPRIELPLWHLTPDGLTRTAVWSDAMPPIEQTTAKALLMTGLFRLAGCDLFIHGTGGLVYDRITETWFRDWLGDEGKHMAPMIGVTADLYLPLPHADYTTASAARAKWLAHSAPHNPALAGDSAHAERKQELLRRIDAAPRDSAERAGLYRELHALLEEYRAARAASLEGLDAAASESDALVRAGELARDRTWAFPLHSDEALGALRERVRAELPG